MRKILTDCRGLSFEHNRYAYVLNNPMAMTDPTGLDGTWEGGFGLPWVRFGDYPDRDYSGGGSLNRDNVRVIDVGMRIDRGEELSSADESAETDGSAAAADVYAVLAANPWISSLTFEEVEEYLSSRNRERFSCCGVFTFTTRK